MSQEHRLLRAEAEALDKCTDPDRERHQVEHPGTVTDDERRCSAIPNFCPAIYQFLPSIRARPPASRLLPSCADVVSDGLSQRFHGLLHDRRMLLATTAMDLDIRETA